MDKAKIVKHDDANLTHPILLLVRGLPGSGKSYLSRALQKSLGADQTIVLDPDATNYESKEYAAHTKKLSAEVVDPNIHAYRFLRGQAQDSIAKHKIVIWNQAFTNLEIFNKMCANLRTHAAECGTFLPILVIEVAIDEKTAISRVAARQASGGHGVSDKRFAKFFQEYQSFQKFGYETVAVNGQADVAASVKTIETAIDKLQKREFLQK